MQILKCQQVIYFYILKSTDCSAYNLFDMLSCFSNKVATQIRDLRIHANFLQKGLWRSFSGTLAALMIV